MSKFSMFSGLMLLSSLLVPVASFAGWGAIACDSNGSGACGASWGWDCQANAENSALAACAQGGYNCYVYSWENNECIYGPNGSYACN